MAINTGFVFTDAVPANQAVQMFQLEQAGREALRRNAADNIRTFTNRDIAREQTSQQRAVTESQIAQRDRELGQNQRQFDARQTMLGEDLKLRREEASKDVANANEIELFNALQGEVTSQDPPTGLEFDARAAGMSPQRKEILNRLRLSTIKTLNDQADIAENAASRWNAKLQALKPEDIGQRKTLMDQFEKSRERQFVDIDASTGLFRSLLRRPRADADMAVPTSAAGGPISIQELRNRVRGLVGSTAVAPPSVSSNRLLSSELLPPANIPIDPSAGFRVGPIPQIGPGLTAPVSPGVVGGDIGEVVPMSEILEANPQPRFVPTDIGPMRPRREVVPMAEILSANPAPAPAGEVVRMSDILSANPMPPRITTVPPSGITPAPGSEFVVTPGVVQRVIASLDGAPYFDVPGSNYFLTPAQRSELERWIAANPNAPIARVNEVLSFIRRERR